MERHPSLELGLRHGEASFQPVAEAGEIELCQLAEFRSMHGFL